MNILRIIDEIEQLVENSKNILGKRMVEEEAFFAKVQQLRSALPKALKEAEDGATARHLPRDASASLNEVASNASKLSQKERIILIAQLSADLTRELN